MRKGEATRAAILAAAARRFAEKGYTDCSLRDIAALTGLKAGSVYYHFPSKEDLLDEVLKAGNERLMQAVGESLAQLGERASATDKLRALIRTHVTCFLDVRGDANTYLRIHEYLPPVIRRKTRRSRINYANVWFEVFDQGVRDGEFNGKIERNIFIPFILQSLYGVIEWFSPSRMTIESVCDMVEHVLLGGIHLPQAAEAEHPRARARG